MATDGLFAIIVQISTLVLFIHWLSLTCIHLAIRSSTLWKWRTTMQNRSEHTSKVEYGHGFFNKDTMDVERVIYVTRVISGLKAPYTKWDFLSDNERKDLELTPFNGSCSQCGIQLETEADFAKHYIISDIRYFNLGDCPTKRLGQYDGE
jgi:hypothetical protein